VAKLAWSEASPALPMSASSSQVIHAMEGQELAEMNSDLFFVILFLL
jgi:hypothetical protein